MNHSWILKLFDDHCRGSCKMEVAGCPVVRAINDYNAKYPDHRISWCPVCNGLFKGWREVDGKRIPVYEGGVLIGRGEGEKRDAYDFVYACVVKDCLAGAEEKKKFYQYPGDPFDLDYCFHWWTERRLKAIYELIKLNVRVGNIGEHIPSTLAPLVPDPDITSRRDEALKKYRETMQNAKEE